MKIIKRIFSLTFVVALLITVGRAQPPDRIISSAEMISELNLIKASFTALHPGIYRYETPAQVDSLFSVYQQKVEKPLSSKQYFVLLSQLVTHVKCSHTYLNPYNQSDVVREHLFSKSFLPFLFRIVDRRMIITNNLSANKKITRGDEVLSINGVSVRILIDSLLTVSRSDGRNGLGKQLDNINIEPADVGTKDYTLFDTYAPLFFPEMLNVKQYELLTRPYGSRKHRNVIVGSVSKKERQAIYMRLFGEVPLHEKGWTLKYVSPNTAIFKISDFETWEWKADYRKWLDSVFASLKTRRVKNLVVDIRGNEGGDDQTRDEVLSYLANKPFGCDYAMQRLYRFLSIPDALMPYLTTWDKSFKQAKDPKEFILKDGLYQNKAELNANCITIAPKENHFEGREFLLTDARNSSTSFTLANVFQQMQLGKIIGEPTSGNKRGINGGRFFFLNLPNSKLEIDIPLVWGSYGEQNPDEGVKPDYLVKETQKAIHENRDIQLEYVLSNLVLH
ncbi:MAG: S41 family peptidase [Mucilaginibacter sp.]